MKTLSCVARAYSSNSADKGAAAAAAMATRNDARQSITIVPDSRALSYLHLERACVYSHRVLMCAARAGVRDSFITRKSGVLFVVFVSRVCRGCWLLVVVQATSSQLHTHTHKNRVRALASVSRKTITATVEHMLPCAHTGTIANHEKAAAAASAAAAAMLATALTPTVLRTRCRTQISMGNAIPGRTLTVVSEIDGVKIRWNRHRDNTFNCVVFVVENHNCGCRIMS